MNGKDRCSRMAGRTHLAILVALAASPLLAAEIPTVSPAKVGLDAAGLARITTSMQTFVDEDEIAGAVTLVARRGKIAYLETVGMRDIEEQLPMRTDTIFRIYSMTKPITSVAIMMLVEEGKLALDEPVSTYIPPFAGLRVYAGTEDGAIRDEAAPREMTVRDLLRHTSGLTYGYFSDTEVDKLYRKHDVLDSSLDLDAMVERLSKIPLLYAPGTRMHYSISTDVLGYLVEKASGESLDVFFAQRIFQPLELRDTSFHVPDEKIDRFATVYGPHAAGGLRVVDAAHTSRFRKPPIQRSGGGGLVSTARDYLRFCQMLLNRGELDGKRLLRAESILEMTKNQLPPEALSKGEGPANEADSGFGLGFAVRMRKSSDETGSPVGEYEWGGAASTHFWIAPDQELIVIALSQYMPFSSRLENAIKPIVYGALQE